MAVTSDVLLLPLLTPLQDSDVLTAAMKEFGAEFPELMRPLIQERDEYMVFMLRLLASRCTPSAAARPAADGCPLVARLAKLLKQCFDAAWGVMDAAAMPSAAGMLTLAARSCWSRCARTGADRHSKKAGGALCSLKLYGVG